VSQTGRCVQPPAFRNVYATVPNLHFGWNLLMGIAWADLTCRDLEADVVDREHRPVTLGQTRDVDDAFHQTTGIASRPSPG
jgi:hypothetical protein